MTCSVWYVCCGELPTHASSGAKDTYLSRLSTTMGATYCQQAMTKLSTS